MENLMFFVLSYMADHPGPHQQLARDVVAEVDGQYDLDEGYAYWECLTALQ